MCVCMCVCVYVCVCVCACVVFVCVCVSVGVCVCVGVRLCSLFITSVKLTEGSLSEPTLSSFDIESEKVLCSQTHRKQRFADDHVCSAFEITKRLRDT